MYEKEFGMERTPFVRNIPSEQLYEVSYGEVLELPGNVKVTVIESRHMGIEGIPEGYDTMPTAESLEKVEERTTHSRGDFRRGANGRHHPLPSGL